MAQGWSKSRAPNIRAGEVFVVWMLTYEPLISGLLKKLPHGALLAITVWLWSSIADERAEKLEEVMTQFHHEAKTKFNVERIVTARVGDLFVEEIDVPFEIRESEGQETVFDVSRRKEVVLPVAEGIAVPPTRTDTFAPPSMAGIAAQPASASREVPAGLGTSGGKSGGSAPPAAANTFIPLTPAPLSRDVPAAGTAVVKPVGGK
ncbi:hypothetical protein LTR85_009207 [Meristemomyces frigidus]|nr:hypothetical protein LTR85_009207 [Meristemomyces frigidus]